MEWKSENKVSVGNKIKSAFLIFAIIATLIVLTFCLRYEFLNFQFVSAVKHRNFRTARELVSMGASVNTKIFGSEQMNPNFLEYFWRTFQNRNKRGSTALHEAIIREDQSSAIFFLQRHAHADAVNDQSRTPLTFAVSRNEVDVVLELITRHPKINHPTVNGVDPLRQCILFPGAKIEVVKMLLASGSDPNFTASWDQTALLLAIYRKRSDIADLLLKSKADPNIADDYGETPIMTAARHNDLELVKKLCAYKANMNAVSESGFNVLWHA